jgi:hypothetical protein
MKADRLKLQIDFFSHLVINQSEYFSDSAISMESSKNIWVYQQNYLLTHCNKLLDIYHSVKKVLGENNFRYFACEYTFAKPPVDENLDFYGCDFGGYLSARSELNDIIYLKYISDLDWFVYAGDFEDKNLTLPKGILRLWEAILNDEISLTEPVNIDLNESEKIEAFDYNDEIYFKILH